VLYRTDKPLLGKTALVTGASRRTGRATALGLAAAGADVVVHARQSRSEVEAVAEEVRAAGRRALVVLADISDESEVLNMFEEVNGTFGGIDILINNAAIRAQRDFLDLSLEEWRETMAVIVDGTFLCSREALRTMVERGGGTIVNVGGLSAHVGANNRAHVATAKAALVGLTRSLAVEFAPKGVTVNCVAPGRIGGARSATAGAAPKLPGSDTTLLGREGTVEEAAYAILVLCMPEARYMTGQTVHVSGGNYLP